MKRDEFMSTYWNYYLLLEDRFINAIRYIELSPDNFDSYSIEFVNQIFVIGSEVDIVMKKISGFADSKITKIKDYAPKILNLFPTIIKQEVQIRNRRIKIKPYENWRSEDASKSLFWWQSYNDIKHGRVANIKQANLKTTLYALSGLYTLESFWLDQIAKTNNDMDIPDKQSQLFILSDWHYRYISGNDIIMEEI